MHSDLVDARAAGKQILDVKVISTVFAAELMEGSADGIIENQRIGREELTCQVKQPEAVIILRQQEAAAPCSVTHIDVIDARRLVDHVEAFAAVCKTLGDFSETLCNQFFLLREGILREPGRNEFMPEEGMPLHAQSVSFAKIGNLHSG